MARSVLGRSLAPKLMPVMQRKHHPLRRSGSSLNYSEDLMSKVHKVFLVAAAAAAFIPAAFADTGATWVGGEIGYASHPGQSSKTREQVRAELATFLNEGGQLARGEQGLMPHQHTYKIQGGVAVHTDPYGTMGNVAAPTPRPRTEAVRPTFDPYFNGGPN